MINFTLRPNQVLKGQGSSADSMRLANVGGVHGNLVPNSCMQIVSCTYRKVAYVTIYAHARNMASATLEHAAVEKWTTMEIVVKQTGPHYAKNIHKFEINKDCEFL